MVELVDSPASGAGARKGVRVRLPPRAPERDSKESLSFLLIQPCQKKETRTGRKVETMMLVFGTYPFNVVRTGREYLSGG